MDSRQSSAALLNRVMNVAKNTLDRSQASPAFDPDKALVDIGFTSLDMANLMIAIEAEFDVTIPASRLTPSNFRSVHTIATMMETILHGKPPS